MKKKKGVIIGCFIVLVIIIQSLFIYNNIDLSKLMTGYRVISFTKIAIFGIFDLFVLLYAAAIIIQGEKGANDEVSDNVWCACSPCEETSAWRTRSSVRSPA